MGTGRDLREYAARRDFGRTPEPPAGGGARAGGERVGGARFVVHEHHARRLHWDLRLERDGVLVSWAVPNGIPEDPNENRKAIHVEDHPLSYIDFEGEIPEGSYGAGRVLIWDRGVYEPEKLEEGKLVVVLHGRRLRGRYALFRTGGERDWMIHRMDPPLHPREAMPEHVTPMLAKPARLPADDGDWGYEVKWDGVRAIAYWRPGRLRVESRNLTEIGSRYPELRGLGEQLGSHEAVLDGEIVAFDEQGRPSFERLQHRMHLTSKSAIRRLSMQAPVTYMIFDLLHLDGHSTMGLPYRERRALLERLELGGGAWRAPAYHLGEGRELLEVTTEHGLEGIVAKRLGSPYRPGQRTGDWLKIKNTGRQELVIGGWLPGKGRRAGQIGSLLMGYYEREGARRVLRYAGRVGTGFSEQELERLGELLSARAREDSPFDERGVQPPKGARFVTGELVAEIEFSHWTRERILRHSRYRGLRDDKPARAVGIEQAGDAGGDGQPERPYEKPYEVTHQTKRHTEIEVQGRTLRLSNREKVMYPSVGFSKGDLIDYYAAIAPFVLPHLAGRPLTFKRYPNGVGEPYFYEKRCPAHRPDWVRTATVWSERNSEQIEYCVVEDLPTLIWVANLADIELHTSLARVSDMDTPTALVFDLDPGAPAGVRECCRVALLVKEVFDAFGLCALAKTSGAKGVQVYVPLNGAETYEQTKPFAHAVADLLHKRHPKLVVSSMAKDLRDGRVLIDWSQNDPHKTTVCVYSLRAREHPLVSTPLTWEEVECAAHRGGDPQLSASPRGALERAERHGDLFAPLLSIGQTLPEL
jgi:bifunctional non-homologous end joining protein LigD